LGKDGKPAPSWLADSVLRDDTLKALETRKVPFDTPLKAGDKVSLEFGYYRLRPEAAKKLGIDDPELTKFQVMKRKEITVR
jgi:hypothetical protein